MNKYKPAQSELFQYNRCLNCGHLMTDHLQPDLECPSDPVEDISVVNLININNKEHVEAFGTYLVFHDWPRWFYDKVISKYCTVTYPEYWELILQKKMSEAWMLHINDKG